MKKFYEFINYNDDLEEEDEVDSLNWTIVGFHASDRLDYRLHWEEQHDWIYIVEEEISDDTVIFYNGVRYDQPEVMNQLLPLSDEELEEYIYSNKRTIYVWGRNNQPGQDVLFKDLPEEVKNKLK
jgi:hypothetical protein